MSIAFILLGVSLLVALAAGGGAFAMYSYSTRAAREQAIQIEATRASQVDAASRECQRLRARVEEASAELAAAADKLAETDGQLDHQERENAWLRDQLEQRPYITRRIYKVLTVGVRSTGKTSLTLKWANPLINLGTLRGTKIERYERTVSRVVQKEVATEHVFEIGDWGGEHIVSALHELIREEMHGLLLVVDLGGADATTVDMARVDEQLQKFNSDVLEYYFGPATVSSCKTVVLFINKSDLLSGTPAEVEAHARQIYAPLVNNLMKYSTQVDIRVLVGSASYGHSTHHLFAHFVERILPKSAYDVQLLRGIHVDAMQPQPGRSGVYGGVTEELEEDAVADDSPVVDQPSSGDYASGANGASGTPSNPYGFATTHRLRVVR